MQSELRRVSVAFLFLMVGVQSAAAAGPRAIPFELQDNRIYIPVRVNGAGPFTFILNTGAGASAINERRARDLRLKLDDLGSRGDVGAGERRAKVFATKKVAFRVAGEEVAGKQVLVLRFDELEALAGRRIDGILGKELFDRHVVEIDYAARTLLLHQSKGYVGSGRGERIPIKLVGGWPIVRAAANLKGREPIEGGFLIDSGMTGALLFKAPLVQKRRLLSSAPRTAPCPGFGGETKNVCGRVEAFRLGSLVLREALATFSQATHGTDAGENETGVIGGEILRRFTVVLDYSRTLMILEPNAHFDEPFEFDTSGLVLVAAGRDFELRKVLRVLPESPAAAAGLREGDEIVTIDGQPASGLTLEQIRQMLKQVGRKCVIQIRTGTGVATLELKLRKIL